MQHTVYLFDGFQLDVTRRKLISSGGLVQPLNSRAMEALLLLVANAGELVEKRRLMQTVWPNAIVEDNNLNQCVLAIRKALGETAGSNRYIMTVPGRGYRFVTPVRTVVQESAPEAIVGVTATAHPQRWSPWLGGTTVLCIIALTIGLLRIERAARVPSVAAVELTTPPESASSDVLLRLHGSSETHGTTASTAMLADCLAARPDLRLRVQIQVVNEQGHPVWQGEYMTGNDRKSVFQMNGSELVPDCRDLMAGLHVPQSPGNAAK